MPQKHSRPQGLDKFLNAIEVNLQEKSAYNKQHLNPKKSNIPPEEVKALQQLIQLQRERKIVIKPADKGAF